MGHHPRNRGRRVHCGAYVVVRRAACFRIKGASSCRRFDSCDHPRARYSGRLLHRFVLEPRRRNLFWAFTAAPDVSALTKMFGTAAGARLLDSISAGSPRRDRRHSRGRCRTGAIQPVKGNRQSRTASVAAPLATLTKSVPSRFRKMETLSIRLSSTCGPVRITIGLFPEDVIDPRGFHHGA
jgi:hypothetical protein